MVNLLYVPDDPAYAGWIQACLTGPYTLGMIFGASIVKYTGHLRAHLVFSTAIGGALLAGMDSFIRIQDSAILTVI